MKLADRLRALIASEGPVDVGRFMALCMAVRDQGYLEQGEMLGARGDFITAPEISQVFGELIGLALAAGWQALGEPPRIRIGELGPGRGTLLADLWRATAVLPAFREAVVGVELVEISRRLRARQRETLGHLPIAFHDGIESLPADLPLFLVANEFFDALPIRQYVRTDRGWCERLVAVDEEGRFHFTLAPLPLPLGGADAEPGEVREIAPARQAVAAGIAARIAATGGLACIIDYGARELRGDTLQAVRRHRRVDPLDHPGEADLSSHVDFAALARAARREGAAVFGPVSQGLFLERLGVRTRLAVLLRDVREERVRRSLVEGVARLVAPQAMGGLFQVLAITAGNAPPPPGFEEEERWP